MLQHSSLLKKLLVLPLFLLAKTGQSQIPFTAGNIVVYRIGDGSVGMPNSAVPVFLDEYTPSGVLVQSIPMPVTTSGNNHMLTAEGVLLYEGMLTRSANGQFLVLTGYDAPVGTFHVGNSYSSICPRTIGRIKYDGTINTTTRLSDVASLNSICSAVSIDGTDLWIAGIGNYNHSGGVHYTEIGDTSSVQLNTYPEQLRAITIADGRIFVSANLNTPRIGQLGLGGFPSTPGQSINALYGYPDTGNPTQFAFADLNSSIPGIDVLYVADDSKGLQKYSLVGSTWVLNGTVGTDADDYRGLTISVSESVVTLYATRKGANSSLTGGGQLVKIIDSSGYNRMIADLPVVIATAGPINTKSFRGVALAPQVLPQCSSSSVDIVNATATSISITWTDISKSHEYALTTSAKPPHFGTSSSSGNFYTNQLLPGTEYFFHLRTDCGSYNYSPWTTVPFVTPCITTVTPVIKNITASSVDLSWKKIEGAIGYEYALVTTPVTPSTGISVKDTNISITGLTQATTYYVYIRAVCSYGNASAWSNANFTTSLPPCSVPGISVYNVKDQVTVIWPRSGITNNYEYAVTTSVTSPLVSTSTTSNAFTVKGLKSSTQYYVHVRSNCGNADFSQWAVKPFKTICMEPVVYFSHNSNSASVNWNNSSGTGTYEYMLNEDPGTPASGVRTTDTSYTITGLPKGREYFFHIRSQCGLVDKSEWSTISFHTFGISLYPNPAQDNLTIMLYAPGSGSRQMNLYDALGRWLKTFNLINDRTVLDAQELKAGVYIMKYTDHDQVYIAKFIKQ